MILSTSFLLCADEISLSDISVVGLFADAAMLNVGERRQFLKIGQRSDDGVLLVKASSEEAVIEFRGESLTLTLSDRISTKFTPPQIKVVTVALNDRGQYLTMATINNRPVRVLVDTGATSIAMNSVIAKSLGISTENGRELQASTASGMVSSVEVVLDEVSVGDIKFNNVKALVIEGEYPTNILLGMTFLRQVEISEEAGLMVLKSRL